MMGALSAAITKQQERQNISTAGYQLTSISVTIKGDKAFAELGYTLPG